MENIEETDGDGLRTSSDDVAEEEVVVVKNIADILASKTHHNLVDLCHFAE